MLRHLITVLVLTGIVGAFPVGAMQLTNPQAEYSADRVMQTESATFEQHVYYTPTKERTEMQASGKNAEQMPIQILRKDTKVMWQLMPSQKMYMEYSLDRPAPKTARKDPADMAKWDFEETVVGEEVMEGVNVTKYKTIAYQRRWKEIRRLLLADQGRHPGQTRSALQGRRGEASHDDGTAQS
jgi:hypothetical protein